MTSLTDIQNKGTYLALTKEGLKTEDGFPIGLDYLKSLGVTHIQVLPVLDFQTIDDDDPFKTYNWGYDPVNYFTPEGSYSTDINNIPHFSQYGNTTEKFRPDNFSLFFPDFQTFSLHSNLGLALLTFLRYNRIMCESKHNN